MYYIFRYVLWHYSDFRKFDSVFYFWQSSEKISDSKFTFFSLIMIWSYTSVPDSMNPKVTLKNNHISNRGSSFYSSTNRSVEHRRRPSPDFFASSYYTTFQRTHSSQILGDYVNAPSFVQSCLFHQPAHFLRTDRPLSRCGRTIV